MEGNKEKIQIVVDTNILMSALLKDNSITAQLIRSEFFDMYYPQDGLSDKALQRLHNFQTKENLAETEF